MKTAVLTATLLLGTYGLANARQTQHEMDHQGHMMQNCPMQMTGATLEVADTKTGIALTFTTETGDVRALRQKVQMMAAMHSEDANRRPMMSMAMIPGTATYKEVPNGAQLTLAPKNPSQLDAFRKQVRQHAERMEKGDCSMMQEMMHGMMHEEQKAPQPNDHDHHQPQ